MNCDFKMMKMIKTRTTSLRGTKQSRKNSKHSGLTLDCFTPFAMTGMGHIVETGRAPSLQYTNNKQ